MNPSNFIFLFLIYSFPVSLATTTFTFINKCHFTVWPAVLSNAGHPTLSTTGFELPSAASRSIQSPPGWSGRFWGRTGCLFNSSNNSSCATGDCGAGQVECFGKGVTPPATLAEFSLAGGEANKLDFYDVSLVDGYNLAMVVEGGNGRCAATGCAVDLNRRCPAELRIGEGETAACRSACDVFRRPEYCCSGEFASPAVCRPTAYSEVFKAACPKSYSYAFDDSSSTFTCADAGEFTVTFCPDGTPRFGCRIRKEDGVDRTVLSHGRHGAIHVVFRTSRVRIQKASEGPTNSPKTTGGGVAQENDSWLESLAIESTATKKFRINSLLLSFVLLYSVSILFIFFS